MEMYPYSLYPFYLAFRKPQNSKVIGVGLVVVLWVTDDFGNIHKLLQFTRMNVTMSQKMSERLKQVRESGFSPTN